jgi:16S rRNA (cytidine1402-2'-O)-methyltransferase
MSTLYIIGTPIGNLADISQRALETLKTVDLVAAEDTRHTLQLLSHYDIHKKLISLRSQNEKAAAARLIAALDAGQTAAYCSDAGTPALSDPGALLARMAADAGHKVLPLPGPSAFATLLSVAGGLDKSVSFEGFLSPKPGKRRSRLKELMGRGEAFVVYESPFRVLKFFQDLAEIDSECYTCIGREMTKLHEEYLRGSVSRVMQQLTDEAERFGGTLKGEFAIYVSGRKAGEVL